MSRNIKLSGNLKSYPTCLETTQTLWKYSGFVKTFRTLLKKKKLSNSFWHFAKNMLLQKNIPDCKNFLSHQHQLPKPQTLPLLTPPLCTKGKFAKRAFFVAIFVKQFLIRSLQSTWFRVPFKGIKTKQTHPWTLKLIDWISLRADAVKSVISHFKRGYTKLPKTNETFISNWDKQLAWKIMIRQDNKKQLCCLSLA